MKNLFDIVKPNMFSPFSGRGKRANFDILFTIYDIFFVNIKKPVIDKDDVVDKLTAYISGRDFEDFIDENGDTITKDSRDKANLKIRQFISCGWLEEDRENFVSKLSFSDCGIKLCETLKRIVEEQEKPLEHTGYFYTVYGLVEKFDYDAPKAWVEQILKNTRDLYNSLQSLISTIRRFIQKLLDQKMNTPQEILDLLLYKYQDQVILTVFNNLKGKDNPSNYTSSILEKMKYIRYRKLNSVVEGYLRALNYQEYSVEEYEEVKSNVCVDLDEVIEKFENVDELISLIDSKNNKFHSSTVSKIKFLLNERKDVEGLMVSGLKALKDTNEEYFPIDIFVYSFFANVDNKSLYERAYSKKDVASVVSEIPNVNQDEIEKERQGLLAEDEYSKTRINDFVNYILEDKKVVQLSDAKVQTKDVFMLLLLQIYAEDKDMIYNVAYQNEWCDKCGYEMNNYIISRR